MARACDAKIQKINISGIKLLLKYFDEFFFLFSSIDLYALIHPFPINHSASLVERRIHSRTGNLIN